MNYNRCKIRLNAELVKLRKLRGAGGCRGGGGHWGGRWWDGKKNFEGGQIFGGWYFEVAKMLGDNKQFLRGGTIHSAWQNFFR